MIKRKYIMSICMIFKIHCKILWLISFVLIGLVGCKKKGPPYSPEAALNTFELPKGFKIELVASEPLIRDPVDFSFDAEGRLYVAEMPDYPAGDDQKPVSKVVLLEDQNGDGTYDSKTDFADDLPFVNGVMAWKGGVLVARAPDIIYFKDTTGDGHADIRRVVVTGFAVTNPQLRMSNLRYGIDNWIYGAYYRAGGSSGFPQFADQGHPLTWPNNSSVDSVDIYPGTNFRFRPDDFNIEPSGGVSQFGNAFDADGNQFAIDHTTHIYQIVIPYRYSKQSQNINSVMAHISDHGNNAKVYPITKNPLELHESEIGHFTSGCGIAIYTADLFPNKYQNSAFECEPVSNMVHEDILTPKGGTFVASRAQQKSEFLASTDSWFRPVNSKTGPDGALYIADMYRKLVEHPVYVHQEDSAGYHTFAGVLKMSDFDQGSDRGRIYRVVPKDYKKSDYRKPDLSNASTKELLNQLDNSNRWWRLTAQRLLVNRGDQSAIASLKRMINESSSAKGRIHALWTLEGLGGLDDSILLKAMDDKSFMVRKQAVVLSEKYLQSPEVRDKLVNMANDPNEQVQFQVALTLTKLPNQQSFGPLKKIAEQHLKDEWFRKAVALSINDNALSWFKSIQRFETSSQKQMQGKEQLLSEITSIIGRRQHSQEISNLLPLIDQMKEPEFQYASLDGLQEGLSQTTGKIKLTQAGQNNLLKLIRGATTEIQNSAFNVASHVNITNSQDVRAAVNHAVNVVRAEGSTTNDKVHAIKDLGLNPEKLRIDILDQLLSPQQPVEIQEAVADVLVNSDDNQAMQLLIAKWDSYSSEIRDMVENGFLRNHEFTLALMKAIKKGEVKPSWLSRRAKSNLIQNPDKKIRKIAKTEFGDLSDDKRSEVVSKYYNHITTLNGNILNGKAVFKTTCIPCHQLGGVGNEVGPNLLSVSNRTKIELLRAIINPNRIIAAGYAGYIVQTKDNHTFSGVMTSQTPDQVVLTTIGGGKQTISRDNIESFRPMSTSLMPNGLESNMSNQDMADLIEYLQNGDQ